MLSNAIKRADPSIKIIGCIENNLVTLPPEIEKSLLTKGIRGKSGTWDL